MKMMFGERLEMLEDGRLVIVVENKLRKDGGISWCVKYEVLKRNYTLGNECWSICS